MREITVQINLIRWADLSRYGGGIISLAEIWRCDCRRLTSLPAMASISNPFDTVDFSGFATRCCGVITAGDGAVLAYRHYGPASGTVKGKCH